MGNYILVVQNFDNPVTGEIAAKIRFYKNLQVLSIDGLFEQMGDKGEGYSTNPKFISRVVTDYPPNGIIISPDFVQERHRPNLAKVAKEAGYEGPIIMYGSYEMHEIPEGVTAVVDSPITDRRNILLDTIDSLILHPKN